MAFPLIAKLGTRTHAERLGHVFEKPLQLWRMPDPAKAQALRVGNQFVAKFIKLSGPRAENFACSGSAPQ